MTAKEITVYGWMSKRALKAAAKGEVADAGAIYTTETAARAGRHHPVADSVVVKAVVTILKKPKEKK